MDWYKKIAKREKIKASYIYDFIAWSDGNFVAFY